MYDETMLIFFSLSLIKYAFTVIEFKAACAGTAGVTKAQTSMKDDADNDAIVEFSSISFVFSISDHSLMNMP